MFNAFRKPLYLALATILFTGVIANRVNAAFNPANMPLFIASNAKPMVMLDITKDHQLYFKAYNDYSDLDGDGIPETTYKHSVDYTGYFDSYKCYTYDVANKRFSPVKITPNKYCDASPGGRWSGNFLNWATMSRMDIVRKVLYGGMRSTDTAGETVLERAFIPTDAHSWAKRYADSAEIVKLTGFTAGQVADGITLCNTTVSSIPGQTTSQTVTAPPLIRIAAGDFALWAAGERVQCIWDDELGAGGVANNRGSPPKNGVNGNDPGLTLINAKPDSPDSALNGLGNYVVRVEACVAGLIHLENCKQYPSGKYKPIGLLQTYGDDGSMLFGLFTGSYNKNISGGVLRKNIGPFTDEVKAADGTFKFTDADDSIVKTLNKLRLYGYWYGDSFAAGIYLKGDKNGYMDAAVGDNCDNQLTDIVQGSCRSWGNPMSEIYLESLRYLAGKKANLDFDTDDKSLISGLTTAAWKDPLNINNYCAALNVVNFNASISSRDADQMAGVSDLETTLTAAQLTKKVGLGEGINGKSYFVGDNGNGSSNRLCTAKLIDGTEGLGDVSGICPEGPTVKGSYLMAGVAHYAHTNRIRNIPGVPDTDTTSLKVNTYGVALSNAVPKITITSPDGTKKVTIMPAYRLDKGGGQVGGGQLVDFKIASQFDGCPPGMCAKNGKFYLNWEDSEQGGDFDLDVSGVMFYSMDNNQIRVSTQIVAASSLNPQGFGYVISGTKKDGVHFHSGIYHFNFADPTGALGCVDCNEGDGSTTVNYDLSGTTGQILEDPLYYAAKWGGFNTSTGATPDPNPLIPGTPTNWDSLNNKNGLGTPDGIPDNYFYVTDPAGLETSLKNALSKILSESATASAVAANTASLSTNSAIYQAKFTSAIWNGQLLAKPIDLNGNVSPVFVWDAGDRIVKQIKDNLPPRNIITWNVDANAGAGAAAAFTWGTIGATNQTSLDGGGVGPARLDFLRGSSALEGGLFRNRQGFKLGDIVNSAPAYVGAPPFLYPDSLEVKKYSDFRNDNGLRTPVVYVGANDGMLHGFIACTNFLIPGCDISVVPEADRGKELIAYVPSPVYGNLTLLSNPTYSHQSYVDLTPTAGDAYGNFVACGGPKCWRSVVVGGLRGGGKGYFALDVTDPTIFKEDKASKLALWEFKADSDVAHNTDTELGYSFSEVTIAKMHTSAGGTRWAAIFGNGYGSTSGHAVLYIVDVVTGKLIGKPIVLETDGNNGLSTPAVVDVDGDYIADYIYAGDLQGNMWKVDVRDPDETKWGSFYFTGGTTPKPLFKAKDRNDVGQKITTRPEVARHPEGLPGYMVYFGTGKYIEAADNVPNAAPINSFYGLWDKDEKGDLGTPIVNRDKLLIQTIVENGNYRTISNNPIHWDHAPFNLGWVDDLLTETVDSRGEMVAFNPILRTSRIIFTTQIPSNEPCSSGGSGWLMEVDYNTGGRLAFDPFDINKNGVFGDAPDRPGGTTLAGMKTDLGITPSPTILEDTGKGREIKILTGSSGNVSSVYNNPGPKGVARGRRSWRQLK